MKLLGLNYSNVGIIKHVETIHASVNNRLLVSYFTPNIDHIVRIQKDSDLLEVYKRASFCLNDSRVLSLFVKYLFGINFPATPGSDLTYQLFCSDFIVDKKIAIIGSDSNSVNILLSRFKLNRDNVLHYAPKMNFINDSREFNITTDFIQNSGRDIIFLAVGSPQQELVADYLMNSLDSGVILCVGASIDYLTGKETRAPKFIQGMYLEWLFRFAQSPIKRFRRYFVNCPQIVFYLIRERLLSKQL